MELFSYNPPEPARIDTLCKNELWFSNPETFNDPFETQFYFSQSPYQSSDANQVLIAFLNSLKTPDALCPRLLSQKIIDELESIQLETQPCVDMKFHNSVASLQHLLEEHISHFGVSCFSRDKLNDLMFSYYGAGHRGFMVTYEVNPMKLVSEGFIYREVNYTNTKPVIDLWKYLFSDSISYVLASKSLKWAHENEIRVIHQFDEPFFQGQTGRTKPMPNDLKIKAITAGIKADLETCERLMAAAEHLSSLTSSPVTFHKSFLDPWKYELK